MARTSVYGYMLTMKVGEKIIAGLETTGLKMKANFEEICLKEDAGAVTEEFVDFDTDFTFSGRAIERDSAESGTHEDFETLREALSVGAEVAFKYGRFTAGEKIVTGNCTIREWGEDAGSRPELATWSGAAKATKGSVGFTTYS